MSLAITNIDRESSPIWASHAFMASTTRSAVTTPPGVWTRGGRERSSRVIGERSKIRTPRSSATRRSPRASSAGWTVAPDCSSTPARWVGDPARRATSSGSSRTKTCSPWRSIAATVSSQAPICAALVAAHSQPSWRKCASMPFAVQKPPIASTAPAEARQSRSASSAPTMCSSFANFAHQRKHEAAVAAARAAAADVALDEHDVERRVVLLEPQRGPQARVAAADDADVGLLVALEARRVLLGAAERLLQPQASHAEDDSRRADRPGQDGGSLEPLDVLAERLEAREVVAAHEEVDVGQAGGHPAGERLVGRILLERVEPDHPVREPGRAAPSAPRAPRGRRPRGRRSR